LFLCRFVFFFFQAEDGIRDGHVTGVQTCALPIYGDGVTDVAVFQPSSGTWQVRPASRDFMTALKATLGANTDVPVPGDYDGDGRSEERRVGKECRSRWSSYHEKKKEKEDSED